MHIAAPGQELQRQMSKKCGSHPNSCSWLSLRLWIQKLLSGSTPQRRNSTASVGRPTEKERSLSHRFSSERNMKGNVCNTASLLLLKRRFQNSLHKPGSARKLSIFFVAVPCCWQHCLIQLGLASSSLGRPRVLHLLTVQLPLLGFWAYIPPTPRGRKCSISIGPEILAWDSWLHNAAFIRNFEYITRWVRFAEPQDGLLKS